MAIYHFTMRSRAAALGSSSVAAAAYQSGERLYDESRGVVLDYARKERIVDQCVLLPEGAPRPLADRSTLWNAMELAVKGSTAAAARSCEFAIPNELDAGERARCVLGFAREWLDAGYAVDAAIHANERGEWHAHLMRSGLPLSGAWDESDPAKAFKRPAKPKSQKHYLVRVGGDASTERWVPSNAFKELKAQGYEKVYRYGAGGAEPVRLTKTQAEARGLTNEDRLSKQPVSRNMKRGEDGQLHAAREAEKEALVAERKRWADVANAALAEHAQRTGEEAVTIDHRSNAERGIDAEPTKHEGYRVTYIERKAQAQAEAQGREYVPVTDKRRENIEITSLNAKLAAAKRALDRLLAEKARRIAAAARKRMFIGRQRSRAMAVAARSRREPREVKIVFDADATVAEVMDALVAEASKAERDEPVWKNDETVDTAAQGATAQDFLRRFGGSSQGGSGQSLRHRSV